MGLCRFVWNGRRPTCGAAQAWPPRPAVLRALRARSRAGKARRSVPLTASETPVRSRAWGWLRLFAAGPRARPAARTSPPSGAGLGVGAPAGLGTGIGSVPHETTQTPCTPLPRDPYWSSPDRSDQAVRNQSTSDSGNSASAASSSTPVALASSRMATIYGLSASIAGSSAAVSPPSSARATRSSSARSGACCAASLYRSRSAPIVRARSPKVSG